MLDKFHIQVNDIAVGNIELWKTLKIFNNELDAVYYLNSLWNMANYGFESHKELMREIFKK